MSWQEITFGEFIEFQPHVPLKKGNFYEFIEMADVVPFQKEVVPSCSREWGKVGGSRFKNGDTIFARITPCLQNGKVAKISGLKQEGGFGSTEFFVFRAKPGVSDPDFLYYLSSSKIIREPAAKGMTGASGRARAQRSIVERILIRVPDIAIQRRIAEILSTYDKLIENNRKQIALLEEAAKRLYRDWFIDLRFPGHENTKIVDGVPEGWTRRKLPEIAKIQYGFAFDSAFFNTNRKGLPIVRIRNIPSGYSNDWTTQDADSRYQIEDGDILIGMDGEFYINIWCGGKAYLVQRSCCVKAHSPEFNGYLEQALKEPIAELQNGIIGATVAHLGKKHLDAIDIILPPATLCLSFEQMKRKRGQLGKENRLLGETRDRLLPKLMSGEIEV